MDDAGCVVIGAGPHGLSATAHLRRAGVEVQTFGDPMSFWDAMPRGMLLRSNRTASSIAEWDGPLSMDGYRATTGARVPNRVPLQEFVDYGRWVQEQAVPDLDRRQVVAVRRTGGGFAVGLDDGTDLVTPRVVVAAGIGEFVNRPAVADGLPRELASHTADHRDLGHFAGRSVLVVGGGQSALESAALLTEGGARVEVVARAARLHWLHGGKYQAALGRYAGLVYAPTDVGPMGLSRVVAAPELFRRLPRALQQPMARRAIRPAGAEWLVDRLRGVPLVAGHRLVRTAEQGGRVRVWLDDGGTRTVDHLLFGTGYRVDVHRYSFLDPALAAEVRAVDGYPVLGPGMASSVPGLHFLGAPAARSFGPVMRFVSGGWYGGRSVARVLAGTGRRAAPVPAGR